MLNSQLALYTNEQLSAYTNKQLESLFLGKLITDRTLLDVERWRLLRDKGWDAMTDAERREWLGEIQPTPSATKGMYTHNDLNRVESAVKTIVECFKAVGYTVPDMTIKTNWKYTDAISKTEMDRYFSNVETLRSMLVVYPDTPKTPTTQRNFNYILANNVEKILVDVYEIVENLRNSWYFSGEIYSGEV